jgi:hypothetical protein
VYNSRVHLECQNTYVPRYSSVDPSGDSNIISATYRILHFHLAGVELGVYLAMYVTYILALTLINSYSTN